jgi:hypothetical protein
MNPTRADGCPWLLLSDLDTTLVGDSEALQALNEAICRRGHVLFALNSSRPIASVAKTLASLPGVPLPVAIIGAFGTEIELHGRRVPRWPARFQAFDRRPVDSVMASLGIPPQPEELQTPMKASFRVSGGDELRRARDAIRELRLPAKLIHSGGDTLDVVPRSAGRAPAVLHVAKELGIPLGRIVLVRHSGDKSRIAVPGRTAFFASRAHAGGVIEGLVRLGVMPAGTLTKQSTRTGDSPAVRHG